MTGTRDPDAVDTAEIVESLLTERIVDIVTTGRRTGVRRETEIWTTVIDGDLFVCGTPNASKPGVIRQPRDWLANLRANPELTVRLKSSVAAELQARATPVRDREERRRILTAPCCAYYRDTVSLDAAIDHSPIVRLELTGDAAPVGQALKATGRSSPA